MSDRVELTDQQYRAAAIAAQAAVAKGKKHYGVVAAVLEAVNQDCLPNPAPPEAELLLIEDGGAEVSESARDLKTIATVTAETEYGNRVAYRVYNLWGSDDVLLHSARITSPYDLDEPSKSNEKYRRLVEALYSYLEVDV
jgi:hypothetical protein